MVFAFADVYIEVVEPEIGHDFLQLTLRIRRTQNLTFDQLVYHDLLRIVQRKDGFVLLGAHAIKELLSFALERPHEIAAIIGRHLQDRANPLVRSYFDKFIDSFVWIALLRGVNGFNFHLSRWSAGIHSSATISVLLLPVAPFLHAIQLCEVNRAPRWIGR